MYRKLMKSRPFQANVVDAMCLRIPRRVHSNVLPQTRQVDELSCLSPWIWWDHQALILIIVMSND